MMYCINCGSNKVGVCCPSSGGWYETYDGDKQGIIFDYVCYNCCHEGKVTMRGSPETRRISILM